MKDKPALNSKILPAISIILALLWLAGCKGGKIESGTQPAKPEKPPAAAAAAGEEGAGEGKKLAWSYDPTGKRDPFARPDRLPEGEAKGILQYNLDQMYIDGIFVGAGRDIAHIILPDATDWFIKVGDEIGLNRGRVKQILADGIVVEEQYLDPVDPQKIRIVEKVLKMEPVSSTLPGR